MNKNIKSTIKAICFTASLMCSTSAFAQSGPWLVTEKNGDVFIGQSGVTKAAIKGSSLKVGDTVKTGAKGRVVLTRGEQYMVVAPNSHIRIANPKEDGYLTQVFSYLGSVMFKVDKRKTQHFEVKTPYMAAVVKGTTFNVVVGPEGSTVQVTEGAVEVATLDGGAMELLTPGNIGMVGSSDPFSLNIIGDVNKTINSPNATFNTSPSKGVTAKLPVKAPVSAAPLVREIKDTPINLGKLTNGLIINGSPVPNRTAVAVRSNPANTVDLIVASQTVDRTETSNNETVAIIPEPEAPVEMPEPEAPVEMPEPEAPVEMPEPEAPVDDDSFGEGDRNPSDDDDSFGEGDMDNGDLSDEDDSFGEGDRDPSDEDDSFGEGDRNPSDDDDSFGEGDRNPSDEDNDDNSNGNDQNFGGDQSNGTCENVPNCVSGPNPNDVTDNNNDNSNGNGNGNNGNGNGNGGPIDDDDDDDNSNGNGNGNNGNGNGGPSDDDDDDNDEESENNDFLARLLEYLRNRRGG